MSRGLSTAAKAYVGPRWWTVDLTTPKGATYRFYDGPTDNMLLLGNSYKSYLELTEGFRRTRSLVVEGGPINLINVDQYLDSLLALEPNWEGGLCVVSQFLIGIEELVEIFRGKLAGQRQGREVVNFELRPEFDVAQVRVPMLALNSLCEWRFNKPACGYDRANITVTTNLADRTSTAATTTSITDSTLAEVVNAHVDRFCVMLTGAQKGRVRRVKSNTATAFTFYQPLPAAPAVGDKFKIVSVSNGLPKWLFTATTALDESNVATTATARTIGDSALAMTIDEHKSEGTEAASGVVLISAATGAGQQRRIKTNSASVVTIADDEPDFSPVPSTVDSKFRVLFRFCPKDVFDACENRGRTHSFNGFPTLTPDIERLYAKVGESSSGGTTGRGGSAGGRGPGPRIVR